MATTPSSTSLTRAIGPLSRVKYFSRYWKATRGQRKAIYTGLAIYGGAIMFAVLAKFWGIPEVAIGLGILTDVVALAILFLLWVHLLPVSWIAGFAVGQEGGKEGPSLKDGINQGNQYVGNLAKLFARALNYGSLVFYGIALFQIERDPWKVFLFLGVSIGLFVYFTPRRSFFLEFLVIGTKLFLLIWILIGWTSLAPLQQQTTYKVGRWMELNTLDNSADEARRRAEDREIKARETEARKCFDSLPDLPTLAQKDRCEALRTAVVPKSPASAKDGSPAKTTEPTPQYEKKWSGKFVPSQGELTLGSFDGGLYRVTGSGWRTQVIYVNGGFVIEGEYAINKDGVYHNGSTGRGEPPLPFPGQPYGAIIVKVNGKPEWAANESCFSVPQGATLILSLNTRDDQRNRAGSGGFDLRVEKC